MIVLLVRLQVRIPWTPPREETRRKPNAVNYSNTKKSDIYRKFGFYWTRRIQLHLRHEQSHETGKSYSEKQVSVSDGFEAVRCCDDIGDAGWNGSMARSSLKFSNAIPTLYLYLLGLSEMVIWLYGLYGMTESRTGNMFLGHSEFVCCERVSRISCGSGGRRLCLYMNWEVLQIIWSWVS